ncbi:MAG TPA: YwqI/YxiC family protein [Bacillota bacterium]|nr:YwqI/YxiC family protein [Bacillota bacterium]
MSGEIKIDPSQAKESLGTLKETVHDFEPPQFEGLTGNNQLQFIEVLNEVNTAYKELISQYQSQLSQHIHMVNQSINTMIETDEALSSQIHSQQD